MAIDTRILVVLLILGIALLAGVVASRLATRIGVPALVLFIAVGMILGSDISGWIYFDDAWLAQMVGTLALVQILFNGGLETEWRQMKKVLLPASTLASFGVIITMLGTGLLAYFVLGMDLPMALLVGAIVGSTDAAAVFAVIGTSDLPRRLRYTLESESALNDPMAVFLTLMMIDWIKVGPPSIWSAVGFVVWQMGLGVAAGWAVGWLLKFILPRLRMQASALYPILLFAVAVTTFALVSWANGSGFMAVYILGVFVATLEIPYRQSVFRFHEGLAWLSQIVMFTLLGLLVFPSKILPVAIPAMVVAVGQILFARPLAVWLCTLGMGFSLRELIVLMWSGLRGAVPVILGTYPLLAGVPGSDKVFHVIFFVVLISAGLQGSTITKVADWLRLLVPGQPPRPVNLELVAMERLDADLVEVELNDQSRATGRRLAELSLPEQVTVSAVYRNGRVVMPRGSTRLQSGDVLFVLAHKDVSYRVEQILVDEP